MANTSAAVKSKVVKTRGGNSRGKYCHFPFITGNDKKHYSCIQGKPGKPTKRGYQWCATTANYTQDGKWGYCPKAKLEQVTTIRNHTCKFPFVFDGQLHRSCQPAPFSKQTWCRTTEWYKDDNGLDWQWDYCPSNIHKEEEIITTTTIATKPPPKETIAPTTKAWTTKSGPTKPDDKNPYTTRIMTTTTTTTTTTTPAPEPEKYVRITTGGNSGGAACVFPFVYKGKTFNDCKTDLQGHYWCATSNKPNRKQWGYCAGWGIINVPNASEKEVGPKGKHSIMDR